MGEADVSVAGAAEQQQAGLNATGGPVASPARGPGLHAQALAGECALCGSGSEAEPLGWVVSKSHCLHVLFCYNFQWAQVCIHAC